MILEGMIIEPLKKITHPKGDIYHALKASELSFVDFGEAYFSTVIHNEVKGWKKHLDMTMNLIVPVGSVRFVLFDDRKESTTSNQYFEIIASQDNYIRLTVPPGVWLAFQGITSGQNLLLNIASLEHNPDEAVTVNINDIPFGW
jgi:dTDP-4-dehydrorhamnose 3,5-epimerase